MNGGQSTSTLNNGDTLDNNAAIGDTTTRITYCLVDNYNHNYGIQCWQQSKIIKYFYI